MRYSLNTHSPAQLKAFPAELSQQDDNAELVIDVLSQLMGATPDEYRRFGQVLKDACEREAAENEAAERMTPAEWAAWEAKHNAACAAMSGR